MENVVIVIINGVLIILFIFIEFFYVFNFNDIGLIIYKFEMFYWFCMEVDMIEFLWCFDCI